MNATRTVLIANRGEIALRVIDACRSLGWGSVVTYTDADTAAPHVRAADDAVRVGSYLDIDEVVAAGVAAGAGFVHPGYGFLSERAEFARAVADAGLVLVGPSAEAMELMGRKDTAREVAVAAGVPVVPSYDAAADPTTFDYPVLVKAASGGGGKGMRIVRDRGGYDDAVAAARRESQAAFGDDTLLVEKYVERGRHIEVQVLADSHGHVVHLFERDCSVQRRHQKVLEEAPAPTLSPATAHRIRTAAVDLARHVGYVNAGTVEFLFDEAGGEGSFYFLEMNTRLQVEHPVTEAISGVDLVVEQLRIAAGRPLSFGQDDLEIDGHAIEARVYAEDAYGGFLPQAGTATGVRWPARARVDAALETGQAVSTAYDPMLGKVIARGPSREAARRALVAALDDTAILGLTTNTGFLRDLAAGDAFRDAAIDTAWLDRHELEPPSPEIARILAAKAYAESLADAQDGPFAADGWRLGGPPAPVLLELGDPDPVRVDASETARQARIQGHDVRTLARARFETSVGAAYRVIATVDGRRHEGVVALDRHQLEVVHRGHRHLFARPDVFGDHAAEAGDGTLLAPMPGTMLDGRVEVGRRVTEGETLGTLEAMKMELALAAPFAGTVTHVAAAPGAQVALGALLFRVEPDDEEPGS